MYEFVSYNFSIILNICTLNACLTKGSIFLTRTKALSGGRIEKVCVVTWSFVSACPTTLEAISEVVLATLVEV